MRPPERGARAVAVSSSRRPDRPAPDLPTPPEGARALSAPALASRARTRGFGRLRGLDGLRAIAVAAVVVYHLGVGALPGGWAGVEVFFVVSGYLITALLLAEWRASGRISLPAFWARRARRLLPGLFAMLLGTLAVAALGFPDQVARLRTDAAAAAVYVTNWYLILGDQPYFATLGRPSPLLHLWSLAIEEQFYLLWPLLLWAALRLGGRRAAGVLVVLGIAASVAAMVGQYVPATDPSRVYYGTDTRASGLLVGALLALLFVPAIAGEDAEGVESRARRRAVVLGRRLVVELGGAIALAGVVAAFVLFDENGALPFRGGLLALDVATIALIAAVVWPVGRILSGFLELPPLRWLGTRSYSVYLWHWPVFAFTRPGVDVPLDVATDTVVRLALTVLLAEASYRLVETPIRSGALGRWWARWRADEAPWPRRLVRVELLASAVAAVLVVGLLGNVAAATSVASTVEVPVAEVEAVVTPPPELDPTLAPAVAPSDAWIAPTDRPSDPLASGSLPPEPEATPLAAPATARPTIDPTTAMDRDLGKPATSDGTTGKPPGISLTSLTRIPVQGPILAVGESVLIAASPALASVIGPFRLDAKVGRQMSGDVDALAARAAAGELGRVVILDVGNNGYLYSRDVDRAMGILADVPVVIWVNVSVPREWQDRNNAVIASYASVHPNIRVVDWHAASAGHPELFAPDMVHPNVAGSRLFSQLVGEALAR